MRKPGSVKSLEALGRVRLSDSFFMRDMLYSEVANFHGLPNIPDYPDVAIRTGRVLCETLLEPLQTKFGRITIRSAYRSPSLNAFCNAHKHGCARNEANFAHHIWDYPDANGNHGALATIVVNRFADYYDDTGDWQSMAWWIHDHLRYGSMKFFPKLAAFNIGWHEAPTRHIESFIDPKGTLTSPEKDNHAGKHVEHYENMLSAIG